MTFGASDGRKNGARGGVEPRTGGAVEPVQPIRRGPGRRGTWLIVTTSRAW